jgi:DNA-binding NarL/FixJ family response regulator
MSTKLYGLACGPSSESETIGAWWRKQRTAGTLSLKHEEHHHVAVIECWLPRLNGVEATRQIRGRSPGTEVIMFTANDNANTVRDFMRAGGLGYVLKSDPREILISAIRSAARRRPFVNKTQSQTLAFSSPLTPREYDVLRLIAEGCTSKSVGSLLHIGLKTVQSHRASILRKLDLDSIADLVRYAVRNSIIEA